ncbi:MAG: hypothetical protein NC331_05035 [Lachnospiraceae bacterium]|nr:hypothetical protein [Lachnospiraceae bacterium]MCM1238730.1 hypothetical protein [Lachnospiraceae bacterium]
MFDSIIKVENVKIEDVVGGGIAAVIIIVFMSLLSIIKSPQSNIIGVWERNDTKLLYEFTKDGHIYLNGSNYGTITFNEANDKIEIDIDILWSHTRLFADVNYYGDTITLSNFTDSDNIFGVGSDDTWVFTKVY